MPAARKPKGAHKNGRTATVTDYFAPKRRMTLQEALLKSIWTCKACKRTNRTITGTTKSPLVEIRVRCRGGEEDGEPRDHANYVNTIGRNRYKAKTFPGFKLVGTTLEAARDVLVEEGYVFGD